jgi:hypothetical protein
MHRVDAAGGGLGEGNTNDCFSSLCTALMRPAAAWGKVRISQINPKFGDTVTVDSVLIRILLNIRY